MMPARRKSPKLRRSLLTRGNGFGATPGYGVGGGAGRGGNWKDGNGHQFEEEHIGRIVVD